MDDLLPGRRAARRAARGRRPPRPRRRSPSPAGRSSSTWPTPQIWDEEVIRPRSRPLLADAGIAVLRGNLAPDGAVIKPAAASPHLLTHRGRAVVFDSVEDFHARIDDPDLDVDEDSVLVLRGCGPKGYPGMPEVANMPLPSKLLDARGARHGAHQRRPDERHGVRHGRPARRPGVGGGRPPRAAARRRPHRARRPGPPPRRRRARRTSGRARARPRPPRRRTRRPTRGWERLYVDHVLQADRGADLDFLVGGSGDQVSRESH